MRDSTSVDKYSISFRIPFEPYLDKNKMWGQSKYNKRYLRKETKIARDSIVYEIKRHAAGHVWRKDRIHIDIVVYRPNAHWDAQNFVDVILDAVELGTGINDNQYSHCCDWADGKDDKHISITISQ